jgi:NAD(P)-dependent dehydrogenase (short-subunit alcohol dehydrogenase family)
MTTGNLAGKAAIVTGGAQGIGGATARRLAAAGAQVLIVDVDAQAAGANADSITQAGGVAACMIGDVSHEETARAMVARAVGEFGRLDLLVQNAHGGGRDRAGSAVEVDPKAWREGLDLLVGALFLGAKYAVPAMVQSGPPPGYDPGPWQGAGLRHGNPPPREVGRIVNVSSAHGLLQAPRALVYEVGKSAVIGLTRQMAVDFGPLGITVNAVAPGHIVTERMARMWEQAGNEEGFHLFELHYPVRRTGVPDDVAHAIAFLCSPEAAFINGVVLPVDGGMTVQLQENIVMDLKDYILEHPRLKTHFDRPDRRTARR